MKATRQTMLSLSRLTNQAAFDSLRKSKIRWVAKGFSISIIPDESGGLSFCIIASKKTENSAVKRNRMRRRLRAMANDILPTAAKNGYSYMIVTKRDAMTLPAATLRQDLLWCLKKLGYLNDDLSSTKVN
jgi:ribonuclease P protein component